MYAVTKSNKPGLGGNVKDERVIMFMRVRSH